MKAPYFSDESITLYHGDCRELAPLLRYDAVIADPPYGETSLEWDKRIGGWVRAIEIGLSAAGSMWVFGSFRFFLNSISEFAGWNFSQEIVWEKQNGSNFLNDRFRRVHELAVHLYRGAWSEIFKSPVFENTSTARTIRRKAKPAHMGRIGEAIFRSEDGGPRMMSSVIFEPNCHGYALHPTQKPVGILQPLLRYSTPAAGTVLDPFAGAASTLVAARSLGLKAIGIEIDEKYCELAVSRLSQQMLPMEGSR